MTEQQLPDLSPGYAYRRDSCGDGYHLTLHGDVIRDDDRKPLWFPDANKAATFARLHYVFGGKAVAEGTGTVVE